ncbi:hypothetical protein LCGC14_1937420, partial [marine sediment metagenome]
PKLRLPKLRFPKLPDIDTQDAHIYGGLLIGALGGWQVSPAWTLIALGVVLLLIGVLAPRSE